MSGLVFANTLGFTLATMAGYVEVVLTIMVIVEVIKLFITPSLGSGQTVVGGLTDWKNSPVLKLAKKRGSIEHDQEVKIKEEVTYLKHLDKELHKFWKRLGGRELIMFNKTITKPMTTEELRQAFGRIAADLNNIVGLEHQEIRDEQVKRNLNQHLQSDEVLQNHFGEDLKVEDNLLIQLQKMFHTLSTSAILNPEMARKTVGVMRNLVRELIKLNEGELGILRREEAEERN